MSRSLVSRNQHTLPRLLLTAALAGSLALAAHGTPAAHAGDPLCPAGPTIRVNSIVGSPSHISVYGSCFSAGRWYFAYCHHRCGASA
jgi:hypothetical protein